MTGSTPLATPCVHDNTLGIMSDNRSNDTKKDNSNNSNQQSSFEIVTSVLSSLILDRYDGFLVDQWGVMHNGTDHMPGAPDCIAALATRHNKQLVILSNSPANETATLEALKPLGFDPSHFMGAVTSGMLASDYIRERYPRARVLFLGWKHPSAPSAELFLDECGGELELVTSVDEDPEVVVVQGNEMLMGPRQSNTGERFAMNLGDFLLTGKDETVLDPLLKDCAERKLPLLCIDPDFVHVNPDRSTYYMPGTLAKQYKEFGGSVVYFGKPYAPAFEEGIRQLQTTAGIPKSRIAMIGDSLHHDVAGANGVGLDSILLLGGVHRNELELQQLGDMAPREALEALFELHGQTPTIVVPMLK